jgi:hypothetical protein
MEGKANKDNSCPSLKLTFSKQIRRQTAKKFRIKTKDSQLTKLLHPFGD